MSDTPLDTAHAPAAAQLLQDASGHLARQDYGSALRQYRQALAVAPNNAGAAMGLAMVLNRMHNPAEALQWLERLLGSVGKLRSKDSQAFRAAIWAQVGIAKQLQGQLQPALDAFEKACKLTPTPELQQRIGQLRPLANSPEAVQQLILHARQMLEQDQQGSAQQAFAAALKLYPDSVEALHGLAMLQRQRGDLVAALPLLQKAILRAPDRADYFNDMGMLFQDRGELGQAVNFHKRALRLDPGFTWALINLGVAYKRLGQNDEALAAYRQALQLQPDIPELHNNLGNLLRLMGRLQEAREHLQTALTLRPGYADALANLQAADATLAQTLPAAHVADNAPANASGTTVPSPTQPVNSKAKPASKKPIPQKTAPKKPTKKPATPNPPTP